MYTIMKNWREIPLCEEYGAKIRHVVLHKNGAKYLYIYNYLSTDTKLVEGKLCHSGNMYTIMKNWRENPPCCCFKTKMAGNIITSPLTPNLWKVHFVILGNTYTMGSSLSSYSPTHTRFWREILTTCFLVLARNFHHTRVHFWRNILSTCFLVLAQNFNQGFPGKGRAIKGLIVLNWMIGTNLNIKTKGRKK